MRINKETFLNDLQMVKAGLSAREFIEQSSCFVFKDGNIMTFNDEVACRKEVRDTEDKPLTIVGAVQAASLLAVLEKLVDPEFKVRENEDGELEFRGKNKGFGVTKDAEVFLPIDKVEMPDKWRSIPKDFAAAVDLVKDCISGDETKFTLTCVHLHPEYIEACDNIQLMRCKVDMGLKRSVLVRGSALINITALGMDEFATTKSWIHFKNPAGLIFSCRKYMEEYPSLDGILEVKGRPIVIPKGMGDASDRAAVFASDKSDEPLVMITLSKGVIKLTGRGLTGWYKEVKKIAYDGPPMEFMIRPGLLRKIAEKYTDAHISDDKFKATGGNWEYVTVLGRSEPVEEKPEDEEESEE